jgi:predicted outer membrane protein
MFEIQSSQLALQKKPDRDTKPFVTQMIKDHTATSKQLKALVSSRKVRRTCRPRSTRITRKRWTKFAASNDLKNTNQRRPMEPAPFDRLPQ